MVCSTSRHKESEWATWPVWRNHAPFTLDIATQERHEFPTQTLLSAYLIPLYAKYASKVVQYAFFACVLTTISLKLIWNKKKEHGKSNAIA